MSLGKKRTSVNRERHSFSINYNPYKHLSINSFSWPVRTSERSFPPCASVRVVESLLA